jgi:hypothetical protein
MVLLTHLVHLNLMIIFLLPEKYQQPLYWRNYTICWFICISVSEWLLFNTNSAIYLPFIHCSSNPTEWYFQHIWIDLDTENYLSSVTSNTLWCYRWKRSVLNASTYVITSICLNLRNCYYSICIYIFNEYINLPCIYRLVLSSDWILDLHLKYKQEMCASQNTPVYINYQMV